MNNILVLCIGNICRSPMAEAMIKQGLPTLTVQSAGLSALIGKPADPLSIQLMADQGIDIGSHRAQQISTSLVSAADLILVMDIEQKKYVETKYRSAKGKVFLIGEATKTEVPDPYREGIEAFQKAHALIKDGSQFWVEQINQIIE